MSSPRALVATPYRVGVLVLVVAALAWRAWTVSRWTWQDDDWLFIERGESMGFVAYLFQDYNGHLIPGGLLVTKLMSEAAPLNFTLAVAVVALTCAANVALWGFAFERVARGRAAALLPLAVLALSPITMQPTMWWACAVTALPLQVFLAVMVIVAGRLAERSSRRDLLWLGLAFIGALFFWQKCLFLVLPAVATVVALAPGTPRQRIRSGLAPLAVLLAIALPYVALFVYRTSGSSSNSLESSVAGRSATDTLGDYIRGFSEMFLPGLLGGPWGSIGVESDPFSHQSPAVTVAVLAVTAGGMTWLVLRQPRVLWLLAVPFVYVLVSWGVVLFSTRGGNWKDVMLTERYHVDGIVVAMLTVGLMMGAWHSPDMGAGRPARRRRPQLLVPGMLVLGTSLVVSNVWAAQRMGVHPGREWVTDVRQQLSATDDPVTIWDGFPPDEVFSAVYWGEDARFSRMFLPLRPRVTTTQPTTQLRVITDDGRLHSAEVAVRARSTSGPDEGCGWAVGPGETISVALDSALFAWDWLIQVNTLSAEEAELSVTVGERTRTVPVASGLHQQQFQVRGEVPETVAVAMTGGEQPVCVAEILAGHPSY